MTTYSDKLKDPRWQKKRLEILKRDHWTCKRCYDINKTLNVHHNYYITDCDPWDYPDDAYTVLCEDCHLYEKEHRKESEYNLLKSLKTKFLADDLNVIAKGFENFTLFHASEVVASIFEFICTNPEIQVKISESFWNDCGIQARKKDK